MPTRDSHARLPRFSWRVRGLVLALGLITLHGCGGPGIVSEPVTGVVLVDGEPAPGTNVTFIPPDDDLWRSGVQGYAYTDEEGRFTVEAYDLENKGFYSGEFQVILSRYLTSDGEPLRFDEKPSDVQAIQSLPERYTSREETPFLIEIKAGQTDFTLEVSSDEASAESTSAG